MTCRALLAAVAVALGALAAAAALAMAAGAATPSRWATAANTICAKFQKQIGDVPRAKSLEGMLKATQTVLGLVLRQNSDLAKLPRPAADAASIATLLGYYAQETAVLKGMIAALGKNDQNAFNLQVAKGDVVDRKATALSAKLGASSC